MTDTMHDMLASLEKSQEESARLMEKIYAAAQPGAVFSEPIVSGNYTIILASEVAAGGGFGFGKGLGPAPAEKTPTGEVQSPRRDGLAGGGGGGGGGGSAARPIAAIVIGPDGVKVKPVADVTKIALAGITAWGAAVVVLSRIRKASRA